MTYAEKIKAIREKCIEVNPEIDKDINECSECRRDVVVGGVRVVKDRPIRLADVLVAIEKSKGQERMTKQKEHIVLDTNGDFVSGGHYTKTGYIRYATWNLRADDLTEQSPECIDFLYNLLPVEDTK
jgi:hypothetical protein